MRPILDEANKSREHMTTDYDCYKLETCSPMAEKERFEIEVARARQLTDELHIQVCQLNDEMHRVKDKKVKTTNYLDKFKVMVKDLENESRAIKHYYYYLKGLNP